MNKFSVLMSVYKNDPVQYFNEAFESLLLQTLKPDQIVLVRDGKVPYELQMHLDDLAKTHAGFLKIVELDQNVGLSRALNVGIDYCDYPYIARMDSDDIAISSRFSEQMAVFQNDPSIALLSAWVDQYNEDMTALKTVRKVPQFHDEIVKYSKCRTPFNHTCSMFKKDAAIAVEKYPNMVSFCEDWWLALRLIKRGYRLHNVQKSLLKMRTGRDFYKRRAGLKYLKIEILNLYAMYNENLLSLPTLMQNIMMRLPIRILPDVLVTQFYKKMNSSKCISNNAIKEVVPCGTYTDS